MSMVFALFKSYSDARDAVNDLEKVGFAEGDINAIVAAGAGKEYLRKTRKSATHRVRDAKSPSPGGQSLFGLDRVLAAQHPVRMPDSGAVLAGGSIATTMVHTEQGVDSGLEKALDEILHDHETASTYVRAIEGGAVVLGIRCDPGKASEATTIMERWRGRSVRVAPVK